MKKCFLVAVLSICGLSLSFAQAHNEVDNKTYENFIGVQINALVKQLFTTSNAASGNPYLLVYSFNKINTGWGMRFGAGYAHNDNYNNTGSTETGNKTDNLQFRVGPERAYKLSKKWSAGAGADVVFSYTNSNASTNVYSTDTSYSSTKTLTVSYGLGAMGWLRYHVTERITVGTETSFYYAMGKKDQTVAYTHYVIDPTSPTGYSPITSTTKDSRNVSQGNFSSPVAFFLSVRF